MLTDLTLLEARVDWLTVSAPAGDDLRALSGIAATGLLDEQRRGERLKTWHSMQYDVARAGSWLLATKHDGGYVSVGGQPAEDWARALLTVAHHCSRIDYCVTLQAASALDNPVPPTLAAIRDRYQTDNRLDNVTHYRGIKTDRGVTIGARASAYYGRLYDKTLESRGRYPRGCWRYEIELKRHASEFEHAEYRVDPLRLDTAGRIVRAHWARWGVDVPLMDERTVSLAKQIRPPSDAERALQWLRKQVRPTVDWLFEIGRGEDAKRALFGQLAIGEDVA